MRLFLNSNKGKGWWILTFIAVNLSSLQQHGRLVLAVLLRLVIAGVITRTTCSSGLYVGGHAVFTDLGFCVFSQSCPKHLPRWLQAQGCTAVAGCLWRAGWQRSAGSPPCFQLLLQLKVTKNTQMLSWYYFPCKQEERDAMQAWMRGVQTCPLLGSEGWKVSIKQISSQMQPLQWWVQQALFCTTSWGSVRRPGK